MPRNTKKASASAPRTVTFVQNAEKKSCVRFAPKDKGAAEAAGFPGWMNLYRIKNGHPLPAEFSITINL